MIAKNNPRVSVCVRMSPSDRASIAAAAAENRVSMSAFMLRAGLAAMRAGEPDINPGFSTEAEDALQALTATGLPPKDAAAKVAAAMRDNPKATADEIVAAAYGVKP